MGSRLNQLMSDSWIDIMVRLAAYFILIIVILGDSCVTYGLHAVMGVLVLGVISRLVFILTHPVEESPVLKTNRENTGKKASILEKIKRGDLNFSVAWIGYMILLGVILGPDFDALWVIYGFIGLGVLSAAVTLICGNKSKS